MTLGESLKLGTALTMPSSLTMKSTRSSEPSASRMAARSPSPTRRALDRVDFIVKLLGMVNAVPNFNDSPKVINGCSDLFVEVFGEAGRHARSAVGNVMLPNQISVEIEGIVAAKA